MFLYFLLEGVFFQELAQNLQLFQSGAETFKLRLYVGHDGSMIRLASGLGLGKIAPLRWPALGSEIAFEVRTLTTRWHSFHCDSTVRLVLLVNFWCCGRPRGGPVPVVSVVRGARHSSASEMANAPFYFIFILSLSHFFLFYVPGTRFGYQRTITLSV